MPAVNAAARSAIESRPESDFFPEKGGSGVKGWRLEAFPLKVNDARDESRCRP